jgi:hypothetical protein
MIAMLARQAAIEAIYYEKQPYNPQPGETSRWGERAPIPNLGDYRPDGWKLIDWIEIERMFTTGQERACAWIEQTLAVDSTAGFAMIEETQFTFVIGYFTQDMTIKPKRVDAFWVFAGQIEITTCPDCEEPLEVGEACENCGYDPEDEDDDDE